VKVFKNDNIVTTPALLKKLDETARA